MIEPLLRALPHPSALVMPGHSYIEAMAKYTICKHIFPISARSGLIYYMFCSLNYDSIVVASLKNIMPR